MLWLARGHWLTGGLLVMGVALALVTWTHLSKWLVVLLIFLSLFPAVLVSALWWTWVGRRLGVQLEDDDDE